MSTPKRLNILWAAGLYEGEGTIYLDRRSRYVKPYVRLQVNSTDLDVLQTFRDIVGGGSISGPYLDSRFVEPKELYRYGANGLVAAKIAKRIRPYVNGRRGRKIDEVLRESDNG